MNLIILSGRLTRDPEIRYTADGTGVANYTLAVDRPGRDADANFINCVVFQKGVDFVQKYLKKGMKIGITGHVQTGSYENKEGVKVKTFDVIVHEHEFHEPKKEVIPKSKMI